MKLKELSKQEIEAMSYDDIAFMILTETNKNYKVNELFKKVSEIYGLSESQYVDQIANFFEVVSMDQRFIVLESGKVDLKTKHSAKIIIEEDEEELISDLEPEEDEEIIKEEEDEEDIFYNVDDQEQDDSEDDLQDLMIIDDSEEEL